MSPHPGIAGENALQIATIVKTTQNALIGVVAIALTAYFALKVERKSAIERGDGRTLGQFWERFPKFVLGFIAASVIGTLYLQWAVPAARRDRHRERPAHVVPDLRVRVDRPGVLAEGAERGRAGGRSRCSPRRRS